MEIIENIINLYSNESVNTMTILSVLLMVLFLSAYEFFVYRYVSNRSFYNKSFNISLAILPFFISIIILCLQSNIVITLGTIGALAIIRFRTAIKNPIDMIYLLWSVFNGIVCGCQLYEAGVLTSLFVTISFLILEHVKFGRKPFVLILHGNTDIEDEVSSFLRKEKISFKYKSRNYTSKGYDYAIELTIKDVDKIKKALSNNKNVSKYSIIEYDADDIV